MTAKSALLACALALLSALPAVALKKVLVFHKQNGYIHSDTDTSVAILKRYLGDRGIETESTVDSLDFTAGNLTRFGAVVFLNTNYRGGPLLSREQESAMEGYIQGGGGFVGIHSAVPLDGSFEERIWPWYARLFGARFRDHPPMQGADLVVEDTNHPSTRDLPGRLTLSDEWYNVQSNPREQPGVKILAVVDESGFTAGSGMGDHPVSWYQSFEGGRSWVTLVGHDRSAFSNPGFLSHLHGGILYAVGWEDGSAIRKSLRCGRTPSMPRWRTAEPWSFRRPDGRLFRLAP